MSRKPVVVTYRIVAPHFVAGIDYDAQADMMINPAPILHYMAGRTLDWAASYCYGKGWRMMRLTLREQP